MRARQRRARQARRQQASRPRLGEAAEQRGGHLDAVAPCPCGGTFALTDEGDGERVLRCGDCGQSPLDMARRQADEEARQRALADPRYLAAVVEWGPCGGFEPNPGGGVRPTAGATVKGMCPTCGALIPREGVRVTCGRRTSELAYAARRSRVFGQ